MATLIKNGLLYDGTGNAPQRVDVLFDGGIIREIGNISLSAKYEVIDALECVVSPGFVETSLRLDDACVIFSGSHERELLLRGITSVVGGSFGESLVPFSCHLLSDGAHRRCVLSANRNSDSAQGFFKSLERKNALTMNFGTLIGLETLRHCVQREPARRDFSSTELKKIITLLSRNISGGALGLSVDLSDTLGMLLSKKTLEELARAVKERDGIFSSTLRAEIGFQESFEELLSLARKTGVNLSISNFPEPYTPNAEMLLNAFEKIEKTAARAHIHFDFSPWPEREGGLRDFLPPWIRNEKKSDIHHALKTPLSKKRIVEYVRATLPKSLFFSRMPASFGFLNGKELNAFAKESKRRAPEFFISLLSATNFAGGYHTSYEWNPAVLQMMMRSPSSCIASGMSLFSNTKGISTPLSIAEKMNIPLESVLSAYTLGPAKKYGLLGRGIVKVGYSADIAVFSQTGAVKELFVNGVRTVCDGAVLSSARGGRGIPKKTI